MQICEYSLGTGLGKTNMEYLLDIMESLLIFLGIINI